MLVMVGLWKAPFHDGIIVYFHTTWTVAVCLTILNLFCTNSSLNSDVTSCEKHAHRSFKATRATQNCRFLICFSFHPSALQTLHGHIHCTQCCSGCKRVEGGLWRSWVVERFTFTRHWNLSNDHRGTAHKCQSYKTLDCFHPHPGLYNGQTYIPSPGTQPLNKGPTPRLTRHTGLTFWGGLGSYTQLFRVSVPGQLLREHLQIAS